MLQKFARMLVFVVFASAIAPTASAQERRWVTSGQSTFSLIEADKISWLQIRGSNEATGEADGQRFTVTESADLKWLRSMVSDKTKWIEVASENPITTDKFWRWSEIRVVKRNLSTLDLWAVGDDPTKPSKTKVTDGSERSRILKLIAEK